MLIAILILMCLIIFFNLLILGEIILLRKRTIQKRISRLPQVKPDILRTLAEELGKIKVAGKESEEGYRWTDEFFLEQPILARYLEVEASKEGRLDAGKMIPAVTMYRLLKAQAEADSLADLTKIQR